MLQLFKEPVGPGRTVEQHQHAGLGLRRQVRHRLLEWPAVAARLLEEVEHGEGFMHAGQTNARGVGHPLDQGQVGLAHGTVLEGHQAPVCVHDADRLLRHALHKALVGGAVVDEVCDAAQ